MATTAAEKDPDTLLSLTTKIIRTEHQPHIDDALKQGRATDRYHPFSLVNRKMAPTDQDKPTHDCYGLYLRNGAILMLTNEAEDGSIREDAPFTVRLVHMFGFSRPDINPEELRGDRELRPAASIKFHEPKRPVQDILKLGPGLLGPLPPDLVDSLLPRPAVSGTRATALASHLFAAWLGGVPLPDLEPAAAEPLSATSDDASANSAASRGWLSNLLSLWKRALGSKKEEELPTAEGKGTEPGTTEGAAAAATTSIEAEKPAQKMVGLAEAWQMYEEQVRKKVEAGEAYGEDELGQAWFRELLYV